MYVCLYVCMYVCNMHVCMYVCAYVGIYIYVYVYVYVDAYIYMYKYICVCIYVDKCIYVYVYIGRVRMCSEHSESHQAPARTKDIRDAINKDLDPKKDKIVATRDDLQTKLDDQEAGA